MIGEPIFTAIDELREFLSEAAEYVCVAGRRFHRFARGDFHLRLRPDGLEFETGTLRLLTAGSGWKRTTHRFALEGSGRWVLLKPSHKNELWLRRQQFRWACENRASRRWKILRSSLAASDGRSGVLLRLILQDRGLRFAAVAVDEEENTSAEAVLCQLLVHRRRSDRPGQRIEKALLFVSWQLAEAATRLLDDLQASVQLYCLPDLALFRPLAPAPIPLLWPSLQLREDLRRLCADLMFPPVVRAVIRNGTTCSLEYLGLPFAVFDPGSRTWKFPLREEVPLCDGDAARRVARLEYHRVREGRRAHARLRQDPLYQLYAERWLESLILRDPKLLDPELKSRPVYAQVPAYAGRRRVIDLIAVTESGRLAVIEVKVQKSMDLVFQALSYWQIVRQAQRHHAFHQNGYFHRIALTDEPPLLYCVTPLLALHPEEYYLARHLRSEVEAYLIGINNNWREGIKVLRRERLS
ncbi:MAG: hypothetical protein HY315_05330 [Acidobacteria bacterium]|nr:hypothetical protein [Acidobacteriota bacterium]